MVINIQHKLYYEVTYNFGIHHIHRKHHLHHETYCTTKTIDAAISARMQQGSSFSSLTR